jgi:hypothetical protein
MLSAEAQSTVGRQTATATTAQSQPSVPNISSDKTNETSSGTGVVEEQLATATTNQSQPSNVTSESQTMKETSSVEKVLEEQTSSEGNAPTQPSDPVSESQETTEMSSAKEAAKETATEHQTSAALDPTQRSTKNSKRSQRKLDKLKLNLLPQLRG